MRRSRWTSIICFSKLTEANLVKVDEMMASLETTSEAQKNRRAVVFYMDRGKSGKFFCVFFVHFLLRKAATQLVDKGLAIFWVGRTRGGVRHRGDGSPVRGSRYQRPMHPRHSTVLGKVQRVWKVLLQALYRLALLLRQELRFMQTFQESLTGSLVMTST